MPPKRRTRLSSRPRLSVAAAAAPCSRGWLAARRRPAKRPRRLVDSQGLPLTDEILVSIFAGFPEIADLVRISATCRRWRRLVSSDAAFICRTPRRPARYLSCLALGFFHHDAYAAGAAPRFAPTVSATRLLALRPGQTSLNKLVEDLDDGLFDSSRLVASRNGLLVVDLRRGQHDRALRLCVCNPMTGETDVLPPLTGKDGLGHYACTVITADDRDDHKNSNPPRSPSAYRLLVVYSRRGFTASRSYSSEEGTWSPEAKVTNARLGKKQMGLTHAGAVVRGGKEVYWIAKNVAFGLHVDTSEAKVLNLPRGRSLPCPRYFTVANTLLGVSPDGSLCAVQIEQLPLVATETRPRSTALRVFTWSNAGDDVPTPWNGGNWEKKKVIQVDKLLPDKVTTVRLRWFCEKSGVVLFTAGYRLWVQRGEVYALSLETEEVEKLASHDGAFDPWWNLHGYEMDRAAYLAMLGEGDAAEEE